jgi:Na+/melibiose symporter-like transporter
LVRALVIGALGVAILTATLPIEALYAAAFLVGTGETVVSAALRATVPLLAEGDVVVSTNGYVNAARTTGTQFAGPAIGGVIFSAAASVPFLGDALSYVVSAVLLRTTIPDNPALLTRSTTTIWADVKEGMRWFLANRTLRVLAALVTSFAFCQAMVLAVFVLYATRNLHLHATGYGILLAVAGVGDVAASLLARRIHARLGPWVTVVVAGIFAAGGYLLLSSTSSAYVAALALAVEAAATSLGNVATLSIRHRLIPNERFGLTNNAFRMSVTGLIPVGAIVGGALTATIGAPHAFMIAGVIQLVAVAVAAIPLRRAEL